MLPLYRRHSAPILFVTAIRLYRNQQRQFSYAHHLLQYQVNIKNKHDLITIMYGDAPCFRTPFDFPIQSGTFFLNGKHAKETPLLSTLIIPDLIHLQYTIFLFVTRGGFPVNFEGLTENSSSAA